MSRTKIQLFTLTLTAALMLVAGAAKAQAQEYVVLKTAQVINFQPVQGTQDGVRNTLRRVTDCYWIFHLPTRAFYFWPLEYIQANKQPLVGTYSFRDGQIVINASAAGTSFFSISLNQIVGTITSNNASQLEAKIDWVVGGGSAGAAGGSLFGNDSVGHYKITASLIQNQQ